MSDETMDELFGLMRVAKAQQEAVQAALDGLEKARAALAQERAQLVGQLDARVGSLQMATDGVIAAVGNVNKAARDAVPSIQSATRDAVDQSIQQSMAGISATAADALTNATQPVVNSLSDVMASAGKAEAALKNAGRWFAWKWVAIAAGGAVIPP